MSNFDTYMKFKVILEVPDETIGIYKDWVKEEKDTAIDLNDKTNIEMIVSDMIQEQTKWVVESCSKLDE